MSYCIYVGETTKGPSVRIMRSETWMWPEEAGRRLAKDDLLNTNVGIWFDEPDLDDVDALKDRVQAIVDYVSSPKFQKDYVRQHKAERKRREKLARNGIKGTAAELSAAL